MAVAAAQMGRSVVVCMTVTTPAIKVGTSDLRFVFSILGGSVIVRSEKGKDELRVALAAAQLGCSAIICMPVTTPAIKVGSLIPEYVL